MARDADRKKDIHSLPICIRRRNICTLWLPPGWNQKRIVGPCSHNGWLPKSAIAWSCAWIDAKQNITKYISGGWHTNSNRLSVKTRNRIICCTNWLMIRIVISIHIIVIYRTFSWFYVLLLQTELMHDLYSIHPIIIRYPDAPACSLEINYATDLITNILETQNYNILTRQLLTATMDVADYLAQTDSISDTKKKM